MASQRSSEEIHNRSDRDGQETSGRGWLLSWVLKNGSLLLYSRESIEGLCSGQGELLNSHRVGQNLQKTLLQVAWVL